MRMSPQGTYAAVTRTLESGGRDEAPAELAIVAGLPTGTVLDGEVVVLEEGCQGGGGSQCGRVASANPAGETDCGARDGSAELREVTDESHCMRNHDLSSNGGLSARSDREVLAASARDLQNRHVACRAYAEVVIVRAGLQRDLNAVNPEALYPLGDETEVVGGAYGCRRSHDPSRNQDAIYGRSELVSPSWNLRIVCRAEQPVSARADAGHEVAGDPIAANNDLANLGIAIGGVRSDVVSAQDVGVLDRLLHGQTIDGHVRERRGVCLAHRGDDHRVGCAATREQY
jgi:hypothetical protein